MDTMEHKNKSGAAWVIGLIILIAILLIVGMVAPKNTSRTDEVNQDQAMMQESDDLDSINSDIDGNLETDFRTDGLGY